MYAKGDRVKHLIKPEWGLGEIVEVIGDSKVKVFFVNGGEKILALNLANLIKVEGADAKHPLLDNPPPAIRKAKKTGTSKRFNSLQAAIEYFLKQFPEGFDDKKYLENERNYKLDAHNLTLDLLSEQEFSSLLQASNHVEICSRAKQLTNKTNLIFQQEKVSFNNGLELADNQRQFAEILFEFLYGKDELEPRFAAFSDCLLKIGAAKWTVATYFLYLRYPEEHIFLKPMATQHAAATADFEINYSPNVNWLTYKSLVAFSKHLFNSLREAGLKPRDMIDIQSFIWCIDEDSYQGV